MIEELVINYIIRTKDWGFIVENNIDESYFSTCKAQFKFIEDYEAKYNQLPDTISFYSAFPSFDSIDVTDSKDFLLDELRYKKIEAYSAKFFNEVKDIFSKNVLSNQDKIDRVAAISKDLSNLVMVSRSMKYTDLDGIIDILKSTYQTRKADIKGMFYETGIKWLDEVMVGWDRDNDYVVVAGRPGTGKSMMLCALAAEQLVRGRSIAFYEGEMSIAQTMERIVAHLSGISATDMLRGRVDIEKIYYEALDKISKCGGSISILTPKDLGAYATTDQLETFVNKTGAEILFIDQQSLMKDLEHAKVPFERAGNISRQIKTLRDKLNIPVITAVQQNRSSTADGFADTSQLAGSDVIAQDATKVLILSKTDKSSDLITASVVKNRSGKSYVSKDFVASFEYCRFDEVESNVGQD